MSRTDVDKIKALSKGSNTPWNNPTFYPEMAKKTVARRHSKVLPMSSDLDDLIRRDDHLYDLDGAREEAQADRPKSLAGRLDALADFSDGETIDGETREVVDEKKPAADKAAKKSDAGSTPARSDEPGKQASAEPAAGNKSPSEESQASPSTSDGDDDPIATARREGAEAKAKKMSRKALPAKYRQDDDLMEAWLLGFDTGEAERQPGEEG
jgi:recombination protein RecT